MNIERLTRYKDEIEGMIRNYQNPTNNFINQTPNRELIEWRILNENEEVDNLYVQNKTLFISDNFMVLKGVDGKLEKWEIKKSSYTLFILNNIICFHPNQDNTFVNEFLFYHE